MGEPGRAVSRVLCTILLAVSVYRAAAEETVHRLGNDRFEATFIHGPSGVGYRAQSLHGPHGRNEWLSPDAATPVYTVGMTDLSTGESSTLTPENAHLQGDVFLPADAPRVTLRHDGAADVAVRYEPATTHPFLRQQLSVTNRRPGPARLDEVTLVNLELRGPFEDLVAHHGLKRIKKDGSPHWFRREEFDGSKEPRLAFETGRWREATWLVVQRKSAEQGLVLGWETSAVTECVLEKLPSGNARLSVTLRPAQRLAAGESFDAPAAFVGVFEGDLDEGCYVTHRYVEQERAWPVPGDDFPYLMFNSWGYGTAITDPLARQAIDICGKLGVEVFVTDFGWEGPDWEPLPESFPNGLAPLADLCHDRNMKFGIHFSFANVSDKAAVYREHPDWVYGEGCFAYGLGQYPVHALSLGLPAAREWAADKVVEVLDREKVDWFLTDTHLWGHIDPAKHELTADQNYLAATGFEATLDAIRRRRPGVLIEHCDGGLSLANYRMIQQHVTSITCDNADALETRLSVYALSHFLPPRYLDKYQQEWLSHYANRSCMFGGPWILMTPIHRLEPGSRDWDELVDDIRLYKRYRARIRDGKVLHLLAPGDPADPAWDGWDAIGAYNPVEDGAIVFAFRTRGDTASRVVPMKGLPPDRAYRVTCVDSGQTYTASGSEIVRDGFNLTLEAYAADPKSRCSEVIVIDPVSPDAAALH